MPVTSDDGGNAQPGDQPLVPRQWCYICGTALWDWSRACRMNSLVGAVVLCYGCAARQGAHERADWSETLIGFRDAAHWKRGTRKGKN